MKLFGRKQPALSQGRRRPVVMDDQMPRRSGQAFSYHSQRSQEAGNTNRRDPDDVVSDRKQALAVSSITRHRTLYTVACCLAVVVACYALFLGPNPRVVLIEDASTEHFLQDASVYQQSVQTSLTTSVFNRNKLTIDTAQVRRDLLSRYPEVKNVSVALPVFGHQPQVYIEPYRPSFILTTTSSNAFLLDSTGRALATASQIANIDKLAVPTLQDQTGTDVKLGSRALPSTAISFTQTVLAALKAENVDASSLVLPPAAYELDVYIAETPYFVKFNLQNDPLQQAGTFLAAKKRLAIDKVVPAQYVDVRVPERAYYK